MQVASCGWTGTNASSFDGESKYRRSYAKIASRRYATAQSSTSPIPAPGSPSIPVRKFRRNSRSSQNAAGVKRASPDLPPAWRRAADRPGNAAWYGAPVVRREWFSAGGILPGPPRFSGPTHPTAKRLIDFFERPIDCHGHSAADAIRAPSVRLLNLAQTTSGSTSGR